MAFELYISKNVRRQKQFAPYIPFSDDSHLPSCTTIVYEAELDEQLYQNAGLKFESYIDQSKQNVVTELDYHTTASGDGVIIQSKKAQSNGIVFVHDNFQRMDAIADTKHASSNMLYDTLLCGYQFVAANAGALMMHAAAVIYRGEAILFCGVSGSGKSTQAKLWIDEFGAEPINYDHPCIIWEGDTPMAYGTPWGGKEKFCQPVSAPVKACVFLKKSETDSIRKMSTGEAFANLLIHNAMPHVREDIDKKYHDIVVKLASQIPVYEQECTKTKESAEALCRTLFGEIK